MREEQACRRAHEVTEIENEVVIPLGFFEERIGHSWHYIVYRNPNYSRIRQGSG